MIIILLKEAYNDKDREIATFFDYKSDLKDKYYINDLNRQIFNDDNESITLVTFINDLEDQHSIFLKGAESILNKQTSEAINNLLPKFATTQAKFYICLSLACVIKHWGILNQFRVKFNPIGYWKAEANDLWNLSNLPHRETKQKIAKYTGFHLKTIEWVWNHLSGYASRNPGDNNYKPETIRQIIEPDSPFAQLWNQLDEKTKKIAKKSISLNDQETAKALFANVNDAVKAFQICRLSEDKTKIEWYSPLFECYIYYTQTLSGFIDLRVPPVLGGLRKFLLGIIENIQKKEVGVIVASIALMVAVTIMVISMERFDFLFWTRLIFSLSIIYLTFVSVQKKYQKRLGIYFVISGISLLTVLAPTAHYLFQDRTIPIKLNNPIYKDYAVTISYPAWLSRGSEDVITIDAICEAKCENILELSLSTPTIGIDLTTDSTSRGYSSLQVTLPYLSESWKEDAQERQKVQIEVANQLDQLDMKDNKYLEIIIYHEDEPVEKLEIDILPDVIPVFDLLAEQDFMRNLEEPILFYLALLASSIAQLILSFFPEQIHEHILARSQDKDDEPHP